ncbi:type II toxin-antitoxin system HicB family antitoxin [Campylobacter cuniculorum]|uniref:type II toxin-antitoxin system HicB family antitoxin n=1 Tax=Campylobacter cuniculorum TaxID=374106 RepID=UPI0023F4D09E|nr:type II toxin-antitoxin system HicB family antitoxin [Campylobacter cuniculorum]
MKKGQKYYTSLPYKMIVQKIEESKYNEEEFVAFYKEYPKITGIGKSEVKAITELKKAFKEFIEQCLKNNVEIKEPILKEKKVKVMILMRQNTLKRIGEKVSNRSKFLDLAANYILDRGINLETD